jgi:hypothetical protein
MVITANLTLGSGAHAQTIGYEVNMRAAKFAPVFMKALNDHESPDAAHYDAFS